MAAAFTAAEMRHGHGVGQGNDAIMSAIAARRRRLAAAVVLLADAVEIVEAAIIELQLVDTLAGELILDHDPRAVFLAGQDQIVAVTLHGVVVPITLELDRVLAAATARIRTNCSAVEQILFNLIENACKYADQAEDRSIRVQTRARSGQLTICVADQGPGISRQQAQRLFHPFHKSSEEAARTAPGVGLGLALCRRLARDLGGDLQLDRSVSNGACFRLRLPLAQTGGPAHDGTVGEGGATI